MRKGRGGAGEGAAAGGGEDASVYAAAVLAFLLLVHPVCRSDAGVACYSLHVRTPTAKPTPEPIGGQGAGRVRADVLAVDAESGDIVVAGRGRDWPADGSLVWRIWPRRGGGGRIELRGPRPRNLIVRTTDGSSELLRLPPGYERLTSPVVAAVGSRHGVVLVTRSGILRASERLAEEFFAMFLGVHCGTMVLPTPTPVGMMALAAGLDAAQNLWVAGDDSGGAFWGFENFIMFSTDPARWEKPPPPSGEGEGRTYPRLYRWRAPFRAMVADPARAGVWVYGDREDERTDLVHVDPSMAGFDPDVDPPSVVPQGVTVPQIAGPIMAADVTGRVWLAGDTLEGARVYVFDGKAFTDVTPPAEVLRSRRFTQLMADAAGKLYASTDGVGVLVHDGNEWRAHPINEHLPTLEGTELKPVSCMTLDTEGNLWIGTDNNVICWRDEPKG